jgi:hypothetical protein
LLHAGAFLALLGSSPLPAFENYLSNISSPIPPACATLPYVWDMFNTGGKRDLTNGVIQLMTTLEEEHDVEITVWEKGCPENGRRAVMLTLEVLDNQDAFHDLVLAPRIWASDIPGDADAKLMRITSEPNTYIVSEETRYLDEGETYDFFVDTVSAFMPEFEPELWMDADQYNGEWTIEFDDPLTGVWFGTVDEYENDLRPSRMALTGRLSGNWVTPGTQDKGFLLSFNEFHDETLGLFFMSWYTFDTDGNLLWLTGANSYEVDGSSEVSFDIELVTDGVFLGSKLADRQVVGTGRLAAYDCNDLEMTFNLNSLGLGSGTILLRRIFSLEIQGFTCADLDTRYDHVNDGN